MQKYNRKAIQKKEVLTRGENAVDKVLARHFSSTALVDATEEVADAGFVSVGPVNVALFPFVESEVLQTAELLHVCEQILEFASALHRFQPQLAPTLRQLLRFRMFRRDFASTIEPHLHILKKYANRLLRRRFLPSFASFGIRRGAIFVHVRSFPSFRRFVDVALSAAQLTLELFVIGNQSEVDEVRKNFESNFRTSLVAEASLPLLYNRHK